ncbi:hypothetical protein INR49_011573, partial [Caranx melampygus]
MALLGLRTGRSLWRGRSRCEAALGSLELRAQSGGSSERGRTVLCCCCCSAGPGRAGETQPIDDDINRCGEELE